MFHEPIQISLVVIVHLAVDFKRLGQLELDLKLRLLGLNNRGLERQRMYVKVPHCLHRAPFTARTTGQRMHSLRQLLADNLVFTHALQLKALSKRISVRLHKTREHLDKVVAHLGHMHIERYEVILDCVQHEALQFDAVDLALLSIGQTQVEVKGQALLEVLGHAQLDVAGASGIGGDHGLALVDKVKVVVEEE